LQYAAEATARYATIYTVNNPGATSAQIKTAAEAQFPSYAYSLSVPTSDFCVTAYNATTNPCDVTPFPPSCGNLVTVSYPFSFIVTGLFPWNITLTAQGCHLG
jgi:hypothetical protein